MNDPGWAECVHGIAWLDTFSDWNWVRGTNYKLEPLKVNYWPKTLWQSTWARAGTRGRVLKGFWRQLGETAADNRVTDNLITVIDKFDDNVTENRSEMITSAKWSINDAKICQQTMSNIVSFWLQIQYYDSSGMTSDLWEQIQQNDQQIQQKRKTRCQSDNARSPGVKCKALYKV